MIQTNFWLLCGANCAQNGKNRKGGCTLVVVVVCYGHTLNRDKQTLLGVFVCGLTNTADEGGFS